MLEWPNTPRLLLEWSIVMLLFSIDFLVMNISGTITSMTIIIIITITFTVIARHYYLGYDCFCYCCSLLLLQLSLSLDGHAASLSVLAGMMTTGTPLQCRSPSALWPPALLALKTLKTCPPAVATSGQHYHHHHLHA